MRSGRTALLALLVLAGCNGTGPSTPGASAAKSTTAAPVTSQAAPVTSQAPVTPPPVTPPPVTPPVTPPAGGASSGGSGGIPGVVPGTPSYGVTFKVGDDRSKYSVYVPAGYAGAPTGLVLAFHGVEGTATPDSWFQVCTYFCNQDRFIIVAPYGDVNDGGSGAWTQPFGREIMDYVRSRYNVDNKRLYMTAISGGCLPGIWLALASGPATYTSVYGNNKVAGGFQSDFAGVGFSAPAYTPSDPDFAAMQTKTAAQLGFRPSFWVDYGALSQDGPNAQIMETWGTTQGYSPVTKAERPNEGHAPVQPFSYEKQMFDQFAAHPKP